MATLRRATACDAGKLIFVGALWGASFIFISIALASFGPMSIAAGRIALAAVVLVIVCLAMGPPISKNPDDWQKFLLIGIFNSGIPFFLISWGMQFISSTESALLMATGGFSALLISHFVAADERINPARGFGVAVGFCGVLILVIADLLEAGAGGLIKPAGGGGSGYKLCCIFGIDQTAIPFTSIVGVGWYYAQRLYLYGAAGVFA